MSSFEIVCEAGRLSFVGGAWDERSDLSLIGFVEQHALRVPLPATVTGPFVAPSWSDPVWVFLAALAVLDVMGLQPTSTRPPPGLARLGRTPSEVVA